MTLTVLGVPVLFVQGRRLGARVPRLPEVSERSGTAGEGPVVRRVVVVGDSVAAGVGMSSGENTVAGRLAKLVGRDGAAHWCIHAKGGLDAAGVRRLVADAATDLAGADLIVLSVGVNDLKALHSLRRWRRDLTALLADLRQASTTAEVVMLGLPPLEVFPALPRPLRDILGLRGRMLDATARDVVASSGAGFVALDRSALDLDDAFASDGFHPSAATHAALADAVFRLLDDERRSETDVVR